MEIFKSKITNLKTLNLVGGEPLLHKQIIDLCKTARNILPNIIINLHSNGIILNTIKNNELQELYNTYKINFYFSLYPINSYLNNYKKQVERFEQLNIPMNWSHTYLYLNKFTLNRLNSKNINCCKNNNIAQPSFLVKGEYIYLSCLPLHTIQSTLITEENNLNNRIKLSELKDENELLNLITIPLLNCCKNCELNSIPLLNLYLNNYPKYENLTNYLYDIGNFIQNPFFFENIKSTSSKIEFESFLNRCLNGWLDIFIPFSKENSKNIDFIQFKELLNSQININKCNLYFINIDNDTETQKKWFENFYLTSDLKLNTYFLNAKNMYLANKKFYENSRIINKYFLDISNIQELNDPNFIMKYLERMKNK